MPNRRGRDTGPAFYGPLRSRFRPEGASREYVDSVYGWNPRLLVDYWWDFTGAATGYLADRGGLLVSRSTGTPTGITQAANTANGELLMTLAATSEAEFLGVDFTDELNIPATRGIVFEAFIKMPAVALTSVQHIVIGLATAYNATLDSTTKYIRFKFDGSNVVLIQGKDGTTTNSTTTTTTLTAATYYLFTIDGHQPGIFDFYIDDSKIGSLTQADFAATDLLQPSIGIRKDSGTTAPVLTMDFLRIEHNRY
jgi:hypothetical protein